MFGGVVTEGGGLLIVGIQEVEKTKSSLRSLVMTHKWLNLESIQKSEDYNTTVPQYLVGRL